MRRFVGGGLIGTAALLILAYLALVHFTGFAKDVAAAGDAASSLAKTFQGR